MLIIELIPKETEFAFIIVVNYLRKYGFSALKRMPKKIWNKKLDENCLHFCLQRSPKPSWDIFKTFADKFELTLDALINKNLVSLRFLVTLAQKQPLHTTMIWLPMKF